MPKLAYLLYRNPDLTQDEFLQHYRTVHSPLAVEAMPLQTSYVANLADETNALWAEKVGVPPTPSRVGAIAFLRFDDLSVLGDPSRLYASHELEERIATDGAHLFSGMDGYVVDEVVQWDAPRTWPLGEQSPGVKQISLVRRLPELDPDEFRRRYEHDHGPLARVHHPGVWRYVQNFVVDAVTPDAPPLDALCELHFRSEDDFRDRFGLDETSPQVVADDVAKFLDRSTTSSVMTREYVWI